MYYVVVVVVVRIHIVQRYQMNSQRYQNLYENPSNKISYKLLIFNHVSK